MGLGVHEPEATGRRPAAGDEVTLRIEALAAEGLGVGRLDGFVVFVPLGAPGDVVRARVQRVRPRYAEAELLAVLEPGPDRIAPPCPAFGRCGGCALQHLRYEAQLAWKRRWVADALQRIGRLQGVEVRPVLGMDPPWYYRNKSVIPIRGRPGRLQLGFYARRTHRLVPFPREGCAIQHPRIEAAVRAAARWLNAPGRGLAGYDPETGTGLLRHLVVRVGIRTGEVLLGIVVHGPGFAGEDDFARTLAREVEGLVGVLKNVNRDWINAILGPETVTLYGRPYLNEVLGGLRFRVSLASFFQVNPVQAERLYAIALDEALPAGGPAPAWLVDAYSGTGTLALLAARRLGGRGRVTAVEVDPRAVADARANARLSGLKGVEFLQAAAEEALPRLARQGARPSAVILDPPRKGCDAAVLEACLRLAPRRIVYVSCNPATLARDLGLLTAGGAYRVRLVQPVDMFPQTAHVEVVASLEPAGS